MLVERVDARNFGRLGLSFRGVGGGDFGAEDVEPAAVAAGVNGFAVHEGRDGLVAASGVLFGVVEKDGGVGVDGDGAEIRERVAFYVA